MLPLIGRAFSRGLHSHELATLPMRVVSDGRSRRRRRPRSSMILLLCLIVVAAALSIIALALYEGTASPPGTPVAAMAAERVAAEPVQWQVAPEKAGEAGEDSDSREADGGEAGGYVMASFKQGKAMGDGLRLLHSQDALRWEALPPSGKPVLAWTEVEGASVFRDPSMVWDRGLFHLVFTAELCVHQERNKH